MNIFNRFIKIMMQNLIFECANVHEISNRLMMDCMWLRDLISSAKKDAIDHVVQPMLFYRDCYWNRLLYQFEKLINVMNETIYNHNSYLHGQCCVPHAWLYGSEQNQTMWNLYQNLKVTLVYMQNELYYSTINQIKTLPELEVLRLHDDSISPLMSHISKSCDYCKNNNNNPLLTNLKSKAAEVLDKLPPILVVIMCESWTGSVPLIWRTAPSWMAHRLPYRVIAGKFLTLLHIYWKDMKPLWILCPIWNELFSFWVI